MPISPGPESSDRPVRILLVEDNPGDVYLLTLALEESGFPHHLTVLRDGADALMFFRSALLAGNVALPELILLDLNLPRVDGITVIESLRGQPAFQHIPVMLLSSSRSPEDSARARKFNKCMFAVKPSDLPAYMRLGLLARDFWMQTRDPASLSGLEFASTT